MNKHFKYQRSSLNKEVMYYFPIV